MAGRISPCIYRVSCPRCSPWTSIPRAHWQRDIVIRATGIVIGETAVVEDGVSMLHEVTLGGTGKEKGDRHPQPGQRIEPGLQPVALLLDSADLNRDLLHAAFELAAPGFQYSDLGAVAPAEHVTAAIVDAVATVPSRAGRSGP